MDDGKRENNEIKKPRSENVKTIVSVHLHRRQFPIIKPRVISKKAALKRAVLDNRISRPNSRLVTDISECDPLLVEYSFMFQKFILWLKVQTNKNHRCYDIEKLVGPLFCHLYMDIRSSGKSQEAITSSGSFFKAHIDKVDKSKCDDTVKNIFKTISTASDSVVLNGTDGLNFEELREQFRSSRVVTYIKPESLFLLKKFVANSSHVESHAMLLQTLQSWFDFRIVSESNNSSNKEDSMKSCKFVQVKYEPKHQLYLIDDNKAHIKQQALQLWFDHNPSIKVRNDNDNKKKLKIMPVKIEPQDHKQRQPDLNERKGKIKNAIKKIKKLPASVLNIRILNNKSLISCGLIRTQANLAAFAERNILRVMPLEVLVDSVCGIELVDHVRFIHHSKQIYCIALCSENDIICTGSADHSICVYSLIKIKFIRRLWGHLGPVYCIAISENSKYLASGSHDGTARLWSLRSGKPLRIFAGHTDALTSLHFHPNSMYLATGSADRNVRVWCLNASNTVRLLHAAKREVYAVAFSPNGQYLACASDDKKVRIWDLTTSKIVHEFKNRESSVVNLLWSKSGKQLCGGTAYGVVKIWEIKDKDKEQLKEHKHSDSVLRRRVSGRLLSLDNLLGTWTCLSVPKHSPFDISSTSGTGPSVSFPKISSL